MCGIKLNKAPLLVLYLMVRVKVELAALAYDSKQTR